MNQNEAPKKETFGQKYLKKNGWITWVTFAALAFALVITLAKQH